MQIHLTNVTRSTEETCQCFLFDQYPHGAFMTFPIKLRYRRCKWSEFKNPNQQEEHQLAVYKASQGIDPREKREQIQQVIRQRAFTRDHQITSLALSPHCLKHRRSNASMFLPIFHSATDPPFYSYQLIERFLQKLVAIINFS